MSEELHNQLPSTNENLEESNTSDTSLSSELDEKAEASAMPNDEEVEPKQTDGDNSDDKINISVDTGDLKDSTQNTVGQMTDSTINNIKNLIIGDISENADVRFSDKYCRKVNAQNLTILQKNADFWLPSDTRSEAINKLRKYKFLILISEQKISRYRSDIALLISALYKRENPAIDIIQTESLSSKLIVGLEENLSKYGFNQDLIIFNNALRKANISILELLDKLNATSKIEDYVLDVFEKQETYIILSIDKSDISNYGNLLKSKVVFELNKPEVKNISNFVIKSFSLLIKNNDLNEKQKTFFEEEIEVLITKITQALSSPSDIHQLFRHIEYLFEQNNEWQPSVIEFNRLIKSVKDFKGWFLGELSKDRKAWYFVFTLGLLHSFPNDGTDHVTLIEFELFRDALEKYLKKVEEIPKEKESPEISGETVLFQKCRAEKRFDSISKTCYIQFLDEYYSEEVWEIFFEELSLKLIKILPFLEDAESKKTASRIIGRIGELNPSYILDWIAHKSSSDNQGDRVLVGYLFQGILASKSTSYQSICKNKLDRLSQSNYFNNVWTCIAAYKLIGLYDLPYAMDKIATIVDSYLTEHYKKIKKLKTKRSWRMRQLFTGISKKDLKILLETDDKIKDFAKQFRNNNEILNVVRYTIAAICLMIEPLSVFKEWGKWFAKDIEALKVFSYWMLTSKGGIFDQLDRIYSFYDEESDTWVDKHYMVKMLMDVEEKKRDEFIDFFSVLYDNLKVLSPGEQLTVENTTLDLVLNWGLKSLEDEDSKLTIIQFYVDLLSKVPEFENRFFKKIDSWNKATKKNENLNAFATEIRTALKSKKEELKEESNESFKNLFA